MKRFILALSITLFTSLCFAGTLHLRVPIRPEGCRDYVWVYVDVPIQCTFEHSIDSGVVFKKPDGGRVVVGNGQEWWYEE